MCGKCYGAEYQTLALQWSTIQDGAVCHILGTTSKIHEWQRKFTTPSPIMDLYCLLLALDATGPTWDNYRLFQGKTGQAALQATRCRWTTWSRLHLPALQHIARNYPKTGWKMTNHLMWAETDLSSIINKPITNSKKVNSTMTCYHIGKW